MRVAKSKDGSTVRCASIFAKKYGMLVRHGSRSEVRSTQILNVPYRTAILAQITLNWQHFTQARKASQNEYLKLFLAVEPCIIFQTHKILPSIHKDAVPTTQQSLVVYQCMRRCDCRYVGRTSLRLQKRII